MFIDGEHPRQVPDDHRSEPDATIGAATVTGGASGRPTRVATDEGRPPRAAMVGDAVTTALALLGDLSDPHDAIRDGRLASWLTSALRASEAGTRAEADRVTRALPAVRAAAAHLDAGSLEDTYLALLTARDILGGR